MKKYKVALVRRYDPLATTADLRPVKPKQLIGRNQQCPCGSGKKFKNCHLKRRGS